MRSHLPTRDEAFRALGPDDWAYVRAMADDIRKGLAATVRPDASPWYRLGILGQFLMGFYELEIERLPADDPTHEVACKKGCHWCCWTRVEAMPGEAEWIADEIAGWPETERKEMLAKLRENAARVHGLSDTRQWQLRRACAFLDRDTGACRIYERRPLGCRSYMSLSLGACKRDWRDRLGKRKSTPASIPQPANPMFLRALLCITAFAVLHDKDPQALAEEDFQATSPAWELQGAVLSALENIGKTEAEEEVA